MQLIQEICAKFVDFMKIINIATFYSLAVWWVVVLFFVFMHQYQAWGNSGA